MYTEVEDKIDIACENYKKAYESDNIKFNKLDNWLEKESNIFLEETHLKHKNYKKFSRGQIVKVDFGINIGSELCYTHFAIIITKQDSINSDIITVIPITSKKGRNRICLGKILHKAYPNSQKYNLDCYINLSQITSISKKRVFQDNKNYICKSDVLNKIDNALIQLYTAKNIE